MKALTTVLGAIQVALFAALAVAAVQKFVRNRGRSEIWIAAAFGSLGLVGASDWFLPKVPPPGWQTWALEAVVVLLLVFPLLLLFFTMTLTHVSSWLRNVSIALTVICVASLVPAGNISDPARKATTGLRVFTFLVIVQWLFVSLGAAISLWRHGQGQAGVIKMRMRTLALGCVGLTAAIILSALAPDAGKDAVAHLVTQLLAIAAVPLFMLGFTPPNIVATYWRRHDYARLRVATIDLVSANTREEVVQTMLPPLVEMMGANGASIIDDKGEMVGSYRRATHGSRPLAIVNQVISSGHLNVEMTSHSPYFGGETSMLTGSIGALIDVALERIHSTERERLAAEELRDLHDALSDFLLGASHDLRTPIAVVKGFSSTLLDRWSEIEEESKLEYLSAISRQADQLSQLVDDMMTAARLDAGAVETTSSDFLLAPLVDEIVGDFELTQNISSEVAADVAVHADIDQLRRIIRNYVENAFNYGEAPVVVDASAADGAVTITVRDSGDGVDPAVIPHLFERFARGGKQGKLRVGTGLGLSIVKGLAKANSGESWYRPNEPKGACFGVTIPVALDPDGFGLRSFDGAGNSNETSSRNS